MAITSSDFVGRGELLRTLTLGELPVGEVFELVGGSGTGKTAIVREIDRRNETLRMINIDLEAYDPERPGDVGEGASVGSVSASFHHFTALLTRLIRLDAGEQEAEAFQVDVREAYHSEVVGRRVFSLTLAMADVQHSLSPADLAQAWRESKDRVAEAFLDRWNSRAERGRFLVFDNVDDVLDEELGLWLGELLPRLERTAVLLTRRSTALDSLVAGRVGDRLTALHVDGWNVKNVEEYLSRRPKNSLTPDSVVNVHSATEGHPGTIVVMVDLLERPGVEGRADLDDLLGASRRGGRNVAVILEGLIRAQRIDQTCAVDFGYLLWKAVEAVAVTRHFDRLTFEALMEGVDLGGFSMTDLYDLVLGLRFVERLNRSDDAEVERARTEATGAAIARGEEAAPQVGTDRPSAFEDDERLRPGDTFRVHRYIREHVLERLLAMDPTRYHDLHRRAAEHHVAKLLDENSAVLAFSYGDASAYEKPSWQRHKREWLYHRSHAESRSEQVLAMRESARIFLEAFWWWGCYVHFEFCDQVIGDLTAIARRRAAMGSPWPEVDRLARALDQIVQSYPPRSTKRTGDWEAVRRGLVEVAATCQLRSPKDCRTAADFKVRALLDVFLAHSHRFGSPTDGFADRYYAAAEVHLARVSELIAAEDGEEPEPDWNLPWIHFERAELCFELEDGDPERLRSLWEQAAALIQPPPSDGDDFQGLYGAVSEGVDVKSDHELMANLHRLRGDVCWRNGQVSRAATWYRRALLHSYFANRSGVFPDEYTLQFHVEIKARVLTRIAELLDRGRDDEALAVAVEVSGARWWDVESDKRAGWREKVAAEIGGRLRELSLTEIADHIFIPGPNVDDLGPLLSEDFIVALEAAAAVADGAATDLHDDGAWP